MDFFFCLGVICLIIITCGLTLVAGALFLFKYLVIGLNIFILTCAIIGFAKYCCREFKKAYKQMKEEELNEVQQQKSGI